MELIKRPESGRGLCVDGDEASAGEAGGSELNSSWSRIEEGGVGGHAENQLCEVGMSGQEEVSCCSTDESETVEVDDAAELARLSATEIWEVADNLLGMTLGAAGSESTRPSPASSQEDEEEEEAC